MAFPLHPLPLLPAPVDSQEVELTGQEDITLLHGILATESAMNAHKDGQCLIIPFFFHQLTPPPIHILPYSVLPSLFCQLLLLSIDFVSHLFSPSSPPFSPSPLFPSPSPFSSLLPLSSPPFSPTLLQFISSAADHATLSSLSFCAARPWKRATPAAWWPGLRRPSAG